MMKPFDFSEPIIITFYYSLLKEEIRLRYG